MRDPFRGIGVDEGTRFGMVGGDVLWLSPGEDVDTAYVWRGAEDGEDK